MLMQVRERIRQDQVGLQGGGKSTADIQMQVEIFLLPLPHVWFRYYEDLLKTNTTIRAKHRCKTNYTELKPPLSKTNTISNNMQPSTLLASFLPLLASASPLLVPRAGGPTAKPIPPTCTVINPLPHAACGTSNIDGYKPDPSFVQSHLLYEAYFASSLSLEAQAKQCKQQCYGFGNVGDCVASFVGYNVPVPEGYMGSEGGELVTACLLFGEWLTPLDFVRAGEGRYVNATAASIYCPS